MSISKAIYLLIEEKKISKYRVAKEGGITQTALGEIISGKNSNPTVETLSKISKGLGIPVHELIKKAEELRKEED